jgi:hypothetical protein
LDSGHEFIILTIPNPCKVSRAFLLLNLSRELMCEGKLTGKAQVLEANRVESSRDIVEDCHSTVPECTRAWKYMSCTSPPAGDKTHTL